MLVLAWVAALEPKSIVDTELPTSGMPVVFWPPLNKFVAVPGCKVLERVPPTPLDPAVWGV